MLVRQAKDVARQWAIDEGSRLTGFCGVYLAGSVTTLRDGPQFRRPPMWT